MTEVSVPSSPARFNGPEFISLSTSSLHFQGDFNTPSKAKGKGRPPKKAGEGGMEDDEESDGTGMGDGPKRFGGEEGDMAYGDSDDDPVLPPKKIKIPFGGVGGPSSKAMKSNDEGDEGEIMSMGEDEDEDDTNDTGLGGEPKEDNFLARGGDESWGGDYDDSSLPQEGMSQIPKKRPPLDRQEAPSPPPRPQVLPTKEGEEMEL